MHTAITDQALHQQLDQIISEARSAAELHRQNQILTNQLANASINLQTLQSEYTKLLTASQPEIDDKKKLAAKAVFDELQSLLWRLESFQSNSDSYSLEQCRVEEHRHEHALEKLCLLLGYQE